MQTIVGVSGELSIIRSAHTLLDWFQRQQMLIAPLAMADVRL